MLQVWQTQFLGTSFTVSQMPIWCTQILQGDRFRNFNSTGTATAAPDSDSLVYGIGTDSSGTNAVTVSIKHLAKDGLVLQHTLIQTVI